MIKIHFFLPLKKNSPWRLNRMQSVYTDFFSADHVSYVCIDFM